MKQSIAVFGCGGFGREIMPIARLQDPEAVFVSDLVDEIGSNINGHEVISFDDLVSAKHSYRSVAIAIGSGSVRRSIAARCRERNISLASLFSASHEALDSIQIGEGAVFCHNTMLTSNIVIGRNFQCNIYSYIAHDCVIGDYVTFAPRVNCNGNVHIEDEVYVGTGALLKQGTHDKPLRIGRGAVIGMGAVVTKDVPAGSVVVGNPAVPIVKKS